MKPAPLRPVFLQSVQALLPWLALTSAPFLAPGRAAEADWGQYLGGPDRNHFSPATQITPANVSRLKVAWEYHTGEEGEMQCNPIVIGGTLYAATTCGDVFALDPATGREIWRYHAGDGKTKATLRGLAYWTSGAERRIFFTHDSWLWALDARTGRVVESFGQGGKTSLKSGLGPQAQEKWVVSTTPGTVFEDFLIMPIRVDESDSAAPGFIQAFNVRTGTLAWVFRTIPYPGETGYDTWSKDSYRNINVGSANNWAGMSIDGARGLLFVPTGSAAPDFWGGSRLGKNLYANCLLALDARTGQLRWHYQLVHHDLWDRDLPAPPNLVTVRQGGRTIAAVAQITKSGHVYVFDRVTGEPLFPIEEKPFPASDLPGEQAWPTQPLPVKPAPFARQTLADDDISPIAENRAELLTQLRQAHKGPFQPFGQYDTILLPGYDGGGEWGGAAVDPRGIMYVNGSEMAWVARMNVAPVKSAFSNLSPGHQVYAFYCQACHGPELKGNPTSGFPSLVGVGQRKPRDEITQLTVTGKGMMPGLPMLTAGDRQAVVDFLLGTEKVEGAATTAAAVSAPDDGKPAAPFKFGGYVKFLDSKGYPAISPPWGSLTAIDLNTGEHLWRQTLGEFKELTARGIPPTGAENYGGPLVTAGGVLFIGATKDGMFRAYEMRSGKLLWQTELPACGFATPCTYTAGGRQYVVIACGGAKLGTPKGDSYLAFALP